MMFCLNNYDVSSYVITKVSSASLWRVQIEHCKRNNVVGFDVKVHKYLNYVLFIRLSFAAKAKKWLTQCLHYIKRTTILPVSTQVSTWSDIMTIHFWIDLFNWIIMLLDSSWEIIFCDFIISIIKCFVWNDFCIYFFHFGFNFVTVPEGWLVGT